MYAPISLRLYGCNIALTGADETNVKSVLTQLNVIDWIEAGKAETEVIKEDEIETWKIS